VPRSFRPTIPGHRKKHCLPFSKYRGHMRRGPQALERPIQAIECDMSTSAASFTALLPPRFKISKNLILAEPALVNLTRDLRAQNGEELFLQLGRQRGLRAWKEDSGESSAASDENRLLRPKNPRCIILEFPHCADLHDSDPFTILPAWVSSPDRQLTVPANSTPKIPFRDTIPI